MEKSQIRDYIEKNRDNYLEEIFELLKIPSISADPKYKDEVIKAATFLQNKLKEAKADKVELHPTAGFPVVYAEKIIDPSLPTILIYGHYDVQPADPIDLWHSPPFQPQIRDGKIYARGSSDDKGQMYTHVKAFSVMTENDDLACNVKFLIEGEEEVGSTHLEQFIAENKEKLAADVVLISDTSIVSNDTPSVTVGLKGLSYVEIEVTGPNKDLHSGVYGGSVANPINTLCKMIASLKDENNKITIPGFYDKVVDLSDEERKKLAVRPFNLDHFKKDLGVEEVEGEAGYSTIERTGIRPTLDVNGIWGGYIGEGSKTVLPSKAFAKVSMRLVPNQNSKEITEMFSKHFKTIAPKGVKVEVRPHHGGEPATTSVHSIGFKAATRAFAGAWGKEPIPTREGGSIPIVALFQNHLKVDPILMGVGLDSDAIHSPNESLGVFNYIRGIEASVLFHHAFAALSK